MFSHLSPALGDRKSINQEVAFSISESLGSGSANSVSYPEEFPYSQSTDPAVGNGKESSTHPFSIETRFQLGYTLIEWHNQIFGSDSAVGCVSLNLPYSESGSFVNIIIAINY